MVTVTSATSALQYGTEPSDRRVKALGRLLRGRLQPGVLALCLCQRGAQLSVRFTALLGPRRNGLVEPVKRRLEPFGSLIKP